MTLEMNFPTSKKVKSMIDSTYALNDIDMTDPLIEIKDISVFDDEKDEEYMWTEVLSFIYML